MTELESLFYEMMPGHIAHAMKIEGAKFWQKVRRKRQNASQR